MGSTYFPNPDKVSSPFAGSIAVAMNGLMWSDTAGLLNQGYAYPASSMTDQGSESANQAYFGPKFLGVAKEAMSSSQTRSTILVDRVYVGPMTIDSGTYYQGDLVAAKEHSGGTYLRNDAVKKTTTAADAIGYVMLDSGGAVTTVTVCLISRVLPAYSLPLQVLNTAGITMDDGANIAVNTTTGTEIGTASTQKLGFWGTTPAVQPSGAAQAATSMTVAAMNATTGAAVGTNSATNSTPYGYDTPTQADAIVTNINTLRTDVLALNTQVNAAVVDLTALNTLVNTLRANLVTIGIIKGSA